MFCEHTMVVAGAVLLSASTGAVVTVGVIDVAGAEGMTGVIGSACVVDAGNTSISMFS